MTKIETDKKSSKEDFNHISTIISRLLGEKTSEQEIYQVLTIIKQEGGLREMESFFYEEIIQIIEQISKSDLKEIKQIRDNYINSRAVFSPTTDIFIWIMGIPEIYSIVKDNIDNQKVKEIVTAITALIFVFYIPTRLLVNYFINRKLKSENDKRISEILHSQIGSKLLQLGVNPELFWGKINSLSLDHKV
jgi:hypothetical protein